MSHKSRYKMKIAKLKILKKTLDKLGIKYREDCMVKFYGSQQEKAALAVTLPGWRYEIAIKEDGSIVYDHFMSQPGSMQNLGKMVQSYNERAIMAESMGNVSNTYKQKLSGGRIKLVLEI